MRKDNGLVIAVIVLLILFICAVGYICYDKYNESRVAKERDIFQQGMNLGYQQSVVSLYQQAIKCEPIPVTVDNRTIMMIALNCLRQK